LRSFQTIAASSIAGFRQVDVHVIEIVLRVLKNEFSIFVPKFAALLA